MLPDAFGHLGIGLRRKHGDYHGLPVRVPKLCEVLSGSRLPAASATRDDDERH
jgi:hypothetical protein